MDPLEHDIFLAHAGGDRAAAEQLFDLLSPDLRVWLDARSLLPGDDWTKEIPRAQRSALATVILVSRRIEDAYYAREEIQAAIALFRKYPGEHRCVPVFLDGFPANPMELPYGLRALNGLDARQEGLEGVARKLREMVNVLRSRGGLPAIPPAPPVARGPEPLTGTALYDVLCKLNVGAMLDSVILRADLPKHEIRPASAPLSQRAIDIVDIVAAGGPELAAKVTAAIYRTAPHLEGGRPSP